MVFNKKQALNSNKEQLLYLFENCNVNQFDYKRRTPIMYLLGGNKQYNLNLSYQEIKNILTKADCNKRTSENKNILSFALKFNKSQDLGLNIKNFID